jgi:hypothetical protein
MQSVPALGAFSSVPSVRCLSGNYDFGLALPGVPPRITYAARGAQ